MLNPVVPALQRLAKHYDIDGWQDWKMDDSEDDVDTNQFHSLETAVAEHPGLCLQVLAVKWGLEYGQLERPTRLDASPTAHKRKADGDSGSRRVRLRKGSEVTILSNEIEEVIVRSKQSSGPGPLLPAMYIRTTLEEVLREHHVPGMSEESAEIRWGTDSDVRVARHANRAQLGMDPSQ